MKKRRRINQRKRKRSLFIITSSFLILISMANLHSQALSSEFRGQLSAWGTLNPIQPASWGGRYIPELSLAKTMDNDLLIDAEISLNLYGSMTYHTNEHIDHYSRGKLYRGWVRFSGEQYEIRAGMQKINFGTAKMLRPLMWFDSIDPRDPLQLTEGVYGLLGRYFFINNANIWVWGLYGNEQLRGWEALSTDKKKMEYGGRVQYPILQGEVGLSYHHRNLNLKKSGIPDFVIKNGTNVEDKFGIDGRWDFEIGFWCEGVLAQNRLNLIDITIPGIPDLNQYKYQQMSNFGMDYTFDLGNGLYAGAEHFMMRFSSEPFAKGELTKMTALTINYPYNILDSFSTIVYYYWNHKDLYRFFNWQRSYDNWQFYLIAFWNPEKNEIYRTDQTENPFAGKGIQIMVVYNH